MTKDGATRFNRFAHACCLVCRKVVHDHGVGYAAELEPVGIRVRSRNVFPFIAPSITYGAVIPLQRKAPTKVIVFQWPCGTWPINLSPRRQRPPTRPPWITDCPHQLLTEMPSCEAEHMAAPTKCCTRAESSCEAGFCRTRDIRPPIISREDIETSQVIFSMERSPLKCRKLAKMPSIASVHRG